MVELNETDLLKSYQLRRSRSDDMPTAMGIMSCWKKNVKIEQDSKTPRSRTHSR